MHIETKTEMKRWCVEWAKTLQPGDVVSLEGDLGAGKTQLVRWITESWGGKVPATSPTFAIVHHYITSRYPIYHLDLYRFEHPQELEELDYETYFYPEDAVTFLEWADRAGDYLPMGMKHIKIVSLGKEEREVEEWQD